MPPGFFMGGRVLTTALAVFVLLGRVLTSCTGAVEALFRHGKTDFERGKSVFPA